MQSCLLSSMCSDIPHESWSSKAGGSEDARVAQELG